MGELRARHAAAEARSMEFFRAPSLSMTIYALPAGATDEQQPHNEDEVYYVVEGRAQFRVEDESRAVQAGSVLFVEKHVEHRFHAIEEDLTLLVFFAPAKT